MMRDYTLTSPSLYGVLRHDSLGYGGIARPVEILRVFDKPASEQVHELNDSEKQKILEEYFHDVYGLFMRKLSYFITEAEVRLDDELRLLALLQELIKVKKMLGMKNEVKSQ